MARKLLQINITANWGSHGKIAEGIGNVVMSHGWESHVAYGRWSNPSSSQLYHIGSMADERIHGVCSRILDNQGLMSRHATHKLVEYAKRLDPDVIHLHNIHGYYLNYPILFSYLAGCGKPVVWTMHDCWPYTGHCAHYMYVGCDKWKTRCGECAQKRAYPKSLVFDRSARNYDLKKRCFLSVADMTLVPVSRWLEGEVRQSFFKDTRVTLIHNGIDTDVFKPETHTCGVARKYGIPAEGHVVLGVASNWWRKGFDDFLRLNQMLGKGYAMVLVGLSDKDMRSLPPGVIGIRRTQDVTELRALYSLADVFLNLTWEDNFPTTNLEALACGTPVITYRTGGSPEAVDASTGFVVERGDLGTVCQLVKEVCAMPPHAFSDNCRRRVTENFDRNICYEKYYELYQRLLPNL